MQPLRESAPHQTKTDVLGVCAKDVSSGLAAFEALPFWAIGNCSANTLATSVGIMNCTRTDFRRDSGTEIVARKTTLPSSA